MDVYRDINGNFCFDRKDHCLDCPKYKSNGSCSIYEEAFRLIRAESLVSEHKEGNKWNL